MEAEQQRVVLEQGGFTETPEAAELPLARTPLDARSFAPRETEQPPLAPAAARRPRRRRRLLAAALATVGALALAQLGVDLVAAARESPLLGGAWLVAGGVLLALAGTALGREWGRLRRLRQGQDARALADELLAHEGVGQAAGFCEALARRSGMLQTEGYRRWSAALDATHNNREVLRLYSQIVLADADRAALRSVVKRSGDTAVAVALSPFAAVDMLFLLWRSMRMIEEITVAYGIESGYWSRIGLVRDVLRNMALAGAAEVATEVGAEALGASVTARVSARAAQGIGAGLLTARLGLRAMDACRPLPWCADDKPRLADVRKAVTASVGEYLRNI